MDARWLRICGAMLCLWAGVAGAETWPARPVTIVVGGAPGGVTDVRARELAPLLERDLGQPVVIDNRPGAMGVIGVDRVAKAKPDGYTIALGTIAEFAMVPAQGVKMPFDHRRDLAPITPYLHGHSILVVPPGLGVTTVDELVALLRRRSGAVAYGTAGNGGFQHLVTRVFLKHAGAEATDVAYKGSAFSLSGLVAERIQFQFDFPASAMPFLESGRLRALMTTAAHRVPLFPNVPTARELGMRELEIATWGGFFAPLGTPRAVIDRFNAAVANTLTDAALRKRWEAAGSMPVSSSPEAFAAFVTAEQIRWERYAKELGMRLE